MGKKPSTIVFNTEDWRVSVSKNLDWLATKTWYRVMTSCLLGMGVILMSTLIVYINQNTSEARFHNQNTVARSCLYGGLFFLFTHGLSTAVLFRRSDQMLEKPTADVAFMRAGHALILALLFSYYFFFPWLFPGTEEAMQAVTGSVVGLFLFCIAVCSYPFYKLLDFLQTPTFRQPWAIDKRRKD